MWSCRRGERLATERSNIRCRWRLPILRRQLPAARSLGEMFGAIPARLRYLASVFFPPSLFLGCLSFKMSKFRLPLSFRKHQHQDRKFEPFLSCYVVDHFTRRSSDNNQESLFRSPRTGGSGTDFVRRRDSADALQPVLLTASPPADEPVHFPGAFAEVFAIFFGCFAGKISQGFLP